LALAFRTEFSSGEVLCFLMPVAMCSFFIAVSCLPVCTHRNLLFVHCLRVCVLFPVSDSSEQCCIVSWCPAAHIFCVTQEWVVG
jgi:hypothetical protein